MKPLPLHNKRIAVAGARRFAELKTIINKLGGEAHLRPMMSSSANDRPEVDKAVRQLAGQGADWLVLVTGIGTRALLAKAEELSVDDTVKSVFSSAKLAVRGYKTVKALKTIDLKADVLDDDGTVEGLKRQLEPFSFSHKRVAVQLHGERMPELTDWLTKQGASVLEIPLYFYDPPPQKDVQTLLYETLSADIDAIAFTSNTQVKYFFQGAKALGATSFLQKALNERVIALSVGSMTTKALKAHGITRIVAPEHERMGAMMMALAGHYQDKETQTSFPVVLTDLKKVLVIGGGSVATRKVKALLEAGVSPIVIGPEIGNELRHILQEHGLKHQLASYNSMLINNADLVIAATNDADTNKQIAQDAAAKNILCNVVDTPSLGTVNTLGTIRRGNVLITVSSNGKSPALTRALRHKLDQTLAPGYGVLADVLAEKRDVLQTLPGAFRQELTTILLQDDMVKKLSECNRGQARSIFDKQLSLLKLRSAVHA